MTFKIFDLWDISEVQVEDLGLKRYINLDARLVLKSHGRAREKFGKAKVNIIERLINELTVSGHRGKKHKIITKWATGKFSQKTLTVIETFKIIEKESKQNPIMVFVKAIENATPREEITVIEYGGARYPQAVDTSPTRRLGLALRNIVHGASDKAFNKKMSIAEALAREISLASQNSNDSFAISKKNELEKQANSAR
ncbi:MAG: 30S ribosomal protein S7 [archaeon]